jgi:M6 family metalloprotease-like protein
MKTRLNWKACAAAILAAVAARADIVWNGERVDSWPAQALQAQSTTAPAAGRAAATTSSGHYPSPKGTVYGLTLLIDFSDNPAPFTKDEISDWLNKPGFNRNGCNGSVRDYYLDVSNGQVDFTNEVFGWYRAKHTKAYYEAETGYSGADELVTEVLAYFDGKVDFSRYDNDKNGTTEAVSFVYAGAGLTWGQGLWPHAGWSGAVHQGTKIYAYQMSDMPGTFGIYTFVHESGHMVFGWPDLYWYGDYCTMGNRPDEHNPVAINDFFRADQGWIPFQDVTALDTSLVAAPGDSAVYRYRNPERPSLEGFAWSYLHNTGRRAVIKGSGLFLQHYDFSIDGNTSADQLGLRVVQADGLEELQASQWPTKSNDPKDLFQSGTTNHFEEKTFLAARWYNGRSSGAAFSEVGKPGATLAFRLGPTLPAADATALEAEDAQVVSANVKSSTAASGGSYVTGIDAAPSKVVFTANRSAAGSCNLTVRYANGNAKNSSHSLSVNGSTDSVTYHPTGAWGRFDSVTVPVVLRQGRNLIVFGKKSDQAELDAIRLWGTAGNLGAARSPSVPGDSRLRRFGKDDILAPAWMAGGTLELLDPAGRTLARSNLVADGAGAVASTPLPGRGVALWRCRKDGRILATGMLFLESAH